MSQRLLLLCLSGFFFAISSEDTFGIIIERVTAAGAADVILLAFICHSDRSRTAGDNALGTGRI